MNKITNHLPTAELQALDAAHHMHPFTSDGELAKKGVRVITGAKGVWLKDSEGNRIIDGMAGLWCVNVGYGRHELAQAAARQIEELSYVEISKRLGVSLPTVKKHLVRAYTECLVLAAA